MKLDFSNPEEAPEEFRAVTFNAPRAKKGMRMPSLTALEIQTQGRCTRKIIPALMPRPCSCACTLPLPVPATYTPSHGSRGNWGGGAGPGILFTLILVSTLLVVFDANVWNTDEINVLGKKILSRCL